MGLTPEDMQRIIDEETARAAIRKELNKNKSSEAQAAGADMWKYPDAPDREMWIAVVLTVCFGPLGLLYCNTKAALWLMLGSFIITLITFGLLMWVGWIAAIVLSVTMVNNQNK